MSIKRPASQSSQDRAFAVRPRPLGEAEHAWVQHAMAEITLEYSVELQGICADEAALVLLPEGGDDANGPSFMISREAWGLRLDQMHWDMLTEVGSFATLAEVMDALRSRMAFRISQGAPASVTLH